MPPPGSRSALRIGGLALLGVAVAAGAVGLVTMFVGGESPEPVAQPSPSRVVQPPPPRPPIATSPPLAARPPAATPSPVPSYGAQQPPATGSPGSAVAAPGAGSGIGAQSGSGYSERGELRVYNNSLIGGLAAQARDDFEQAGWTVTEIGGYPGVIPTSTVYYTPGTNEEEQAQEVGREFGLRVEPRFAGIANSSPGVIVIITKEYISPTSP
jgi:hypothetical protein